MGRSRVQPERRPARHTSSPRTALTLGVVLGLVALAALRGVLTPRTTSTPPPSAAPGGGSAESAAEAPPAPGTRPSLRGNDAEPAHLPAPDAGHPAPAPAAVAVPPAGSSTASPDRASSAASAAPLQPPSDLEKLQHEAFKSTVDGDSFRLKSGHQVRMLGVDAPEHDEPLFADARALAKSLLEKGELYLEFDSEREDTYHRLLAYAWVVPSKGEPPRLVQAELLRNGMVRFYGHHQNALHFRELLAAQQEARAAKRGIWALPPPDPAPFYLSSRTSERFHRPDCEHVPQLPAGHRVRFDTRDRALDAGKSRCRTCKP
ncbi:MAG: thermonuclease family protein [Planctomycetes bacterium]|nr:thermonuclease family protein [Planctomycetota bacterium]